MTELFSPLQLLSRDGDGSYTRVLHWRSDGRLVPQKSLRVILQNGCYSTHTKLDLRLPRCTLACHAQDEVFDLLFGSGASSRRGETSSGLEASICGGPVSLGLGGNYFIVFNECQLTTGIESSGQGQCKGFESAATYSQYNAMMMLRARGTINSPTRWPRLGGTVVGNLLLLSAWTRFPQPQRQRELRHTTVFAR